MCYAPTLSIPALQVIPSHINNHPVCTMLAGSSKLMLYLGKHINDPNYWSHSPNSAAGSRSQSECACQPNNGMDLHISKKCMLHRAPFQAKCSATQSATQSALRQAPQSKMALIKALAMEAAPSPRTRPLATMTMSPL